MGGWPRRDVVHRSRNTIQFVQQQRNSYGQAAGRIKLLLFGRPRPRKRGTIRVVVLFLIIGWQDGQQRPSALSCAGRVAKKPLAGRTFNDSTNAFASSGIIFDESASVFSVAGGFRVVLGSAGVIVDALYQIYQSDKEIKTVVPLVAQVLSGCFYFASGALAIDAGAKGLDGDERGEGASGRNSAITMAVGEFLPDIADLAAANEKYKADGVSGQFVKQMSKIVTSIFKIVGCIMVAMSENDEALGDRGTWIVPGASIASSILGVAKIAMIMSGKWTKTPDADVGEYADSDRSASSAVGGDQSSS